MVFFVIFTFLLSRYFSKVVQVDLKYLVPIILVLGIGGGYASNSSPIDLVMISVLGIIGYLMERYGYPIVPLVMGFILVTCG